MPYIFKEELVEGEEAAEVYTPEQYNAVITERDNLISERDNLNTSIDTITAERDSLSSQLVEAKTKFADAFLSKPKPDPDPNPNPKSEDDYNKVDSFDSLFSEGE